MKGTRLHGGRRPALLAPRIPRKPRPASWWNDLNGAGTRYPVTAFALSVAVLALGGLPPLSGFHCRSGRSSSPAFETRNAGVELLVVFMAFNSVLSLAYYAPLVNRMYRHEPSAAGHSGAPGAVPDDCAGRGNGAARGGARLLAGPRGLHHPPGRPCTWCRSSAAAGRWRSSDLVRIR